MALSSKQAAKILGVSVDASLAEISKTFRQLARTCHPDLYPNDPEAETQYRRINEAYTILSSIHDNIRRQKGMETDIIDHEFERWIRELDHDTQQKIKEEIDK